MIATEDQLLGALAGCGFDFTSRVREIAKRFPRELDWGVAGFEVVPYRLTRPFAALGEVWKIPVNREVDLDLPALRCKHEFHPAGDARANHDQAYSGLAAPFGPGEAGESTNVYERHLRVGFFTIESSHGLGS